MPYVNEQRLENWVVIVGTLGAGVVEVVGPFPTQDDAEAWGNDEYGNDLPFVAFKVDRPEV